MGSSTNILVRSVLKQHFRKMALENLMTAGRTFPSTSRVDLQRALDEMFGEQYEAELVGVHPRFSHETLTISDLTHEGDHPVVVGPLQHDEIEVGDSLPARCLKRGLWLSELDSTPFVVLLSPAERFGRSWGVHVEIAVPPGEGGMKLSRSFLDEVDKLVNKTGSYRGKVVSLESSENYSGTGGGVRVHKLRSVPREDVILPAKTLRLLERNVHEFIQQRDRLRDIGMAVKKGLLFYGPPGTGKTHTIHYLASQLPDHTTLLITASQMGLLDEYVQLARFLQPAMVVIEDVDLIARDRRRTRGACEESLLNQLLNEMDGLREDAAILFVLTTNRPEDLEAALASRPGRIDQAIEFPLPDEDGRRKLVQLYARRLDVPDMVADAIVQKTKNASAAFIKELMRRAAQSCLANGGNDSLEAKDVEIALDEMLFAGGSLNVKLLGGASVE